ncbi:hypothetical protein B0H14DRAFT_3129025 [Mycena olivaceomarginata]|nr:hypothetical protein B0H14DRAFT_3129025 [Mycena olivaceomarginata]
MIAWNRCSNWNWHAPDLATIRGMVWRREKSWMPSQEEKAEHVFISPTALASSSSSLFCSVNAVAWHFNDFNPANAGPVYPSSFSPATSLRPSWNKLCGVVARLCHIIINVLKAWLFMYSSPSSLRISAHPSMTFYTIISPISGPGSSVDSQPDADFISCVLQLRLSGTQTVLGWISTHTLDGTIPIGPNGIFLVDVTPTASRVSTYQGYVSHATSMGFTFTVLDTGFATSSSYLDMVDLVNTYEGPYSSFDPSSLSGTLSKQSVTLKSAPTTGSYSGVISQLQSLGVKGH